MFDEIRGKYIIEVFGFSRRMWFNGAKPFVDDINKAYIIPNKKSLEKKKKVLLFFHSFFSGFLCFCFTI